ncbi:hypothetical protein FB451DRAFT_1557019 [Mycena latifolia]|nr:hypothetical protein FB451DRAFT_1557019 [Mycena latifolia]
MARTARCRASSPSTPSTRFPSRTHTAPGTTPSGPAPRKRTRTRTRRRGSSPTRTRTNTRRGGARGASRCAACSRRATRTRRTPARRGSTTSRSRRRRRPPRRVRCSAPSSTRTAPRRAGGRSGTTSRARSRSASAIGRGIGTGTGTGRRSRGRGAGRSRDAYAARSAGSADSWKAYQFNRCTPPRAHTYTPAASLLYPVRMHVCIPCPSNVQCIYTSPRASDGGDLAALSRFPRLTSQREC